MTENIECKPLIFNSLSREIIESYKKLVIPSALELLDDPANPLYLLIGIEARLNNQLIGLSLAQFTPEEGTVHLHSLMVDEPFRRRGIGAFLFEYTQTYFREHYKCNSIGFNYLANSLEETIIEKLLIRFDWLIPKVYLIRCYFLLDRFNPAWFQRQISKSKPKGLKVFAWRKLKTNERKRIIFEREQGVFLPYLDPFLKEDIISPLNSLGVRHNNAVVGWCITHRIQPDTLRYSILFMEKEYHLSGIWLVSQSIQLQKKHSNLFPKAVFDTVYQETDLSWWYFVIRHLAPYAEKVEKLKWAIKFFALCLFLNEHLA